MSKNEDRKGERVPLDEGYVPGRKGYTPIEKHGYTPGGSTGQKLPVGPVGGTGASGPAAPAKQGSGGGGDAKQP